MRLEQPGWWHARTPGDWLKAALLTPAGLLYGTAAKARFALAKPYSSSLPVVCVGNLTVGGAGKTPLALMVARLVRNLGRKPAFLTRGYGGTIAGPHLVDAERDVSAEVGDEALLLARAAPTIVSRDRRAGAKAIEGLGANVIIMDDGFQNPSLVKDFSIIAVDAGAGLGNGLVFPAGPLRAPLAFQLRRAHAVVMIGEGGKALAKRLGRQPGLPVVRARLLSSGDTKWLRGQPLFAFSGIGRPEKFFATLRECGATLTATRTFPDHHAFTEGDALRLIRDAAQAGAALVTTEKDKVRLSAPSGPLAELKALARVLPVDLSFRGDGEEEITALIYQMLKQR
jgi:tetraacyldisaccharide 4'-kinase